MNSVEIPTRVIQSWFLIMQMNRERKGNRGDWWVWKRVKWAKSKTTRTQTSKNRYQTTFFFNEKPIQIRCHYDLKIIMIKCIHFLGGASMVAHFLHPTIRRTSKSQVFLLIFHYIYIKRHWYFIIYIYIKA